MALVISAIIPSIDKIGIQTSDPFTWILFQHLGSATFIFVLVALFSQTSGMKNKTVFALLIAGCANALVWIFQAHAYELMQVAYVQGIKRSSMLLSVIIGYYYFGEENVRQRLFGASIMLLGLLLVILGG